MPRVVFVVGTTASGKSDLALRLAREFQASIVNADSIQMYAGLDIGSAKPTAEEMRLVPHHLFSFVEAPRTITVGEFHRRFFELMEGMEPEELVFVVGGTGFYFQALEKGLPRIPAARSEFQNPLFEKWKKNPESAKADHDFLRSRDPAAASRIHVQDHYRLARALDIMDSTGKPVTQVWEEHGQESPQFPYPLLKVGFKASRENLEGRVRERAQKMLERGLLREVQGVLSRGFADWDPLLSVGYKQARDYLLQSGRDLSRPQQDSLGLDQASLIQEITQQTLRLAKKQRTWFQRDPAIQWLDPSQPEAALAQARKLVQNFMK